MTFHRFVRRGILRSVVQWFISLNRAMAVMLCHKVLWPANDVECSSDRLVNEF